LLFLYGIHFLAVAIVVSFVAGLTYRCFRTYLQYLSHLKTSSFRAVNQLINYYQESKLTLSSMQAFEAFSSSLKTAASSYWNASGQINAIGQTPKYILESTLSLIVVFYVFWQTSNHVTSGIDFLYIVARIAISIQTILAYSFALKSNANSVTEVANSMAIEKDIFMSQFLTPKIVSTRHLHPIKTTCFLEQTHPLSTSLELSLNGITVINGKSGLGKSTILRSLSTFNTQIRFSRPNKLFSFNNNHVYIPQRLALFTGSLADNLTWFQNIIDLPLFEKTLRRIQIYDVAVSSADLTTLSGGEQARIWFAIASSYPASICLLDEPTAALDAYSSKILYSRMRELCKFENRTFLVVSHDNLLINSADLVHTLQ
jgi:ABC-type bacteriocin/lantibiotic exporter with double-glycine peptidase domain